MIGRIARDHQLIETGARGRCTKIHLRNPIGSSEEPSDVGVMLRNLRISSSKEHLTM